MRTVLDTIKKQLMEGRHGAASRLQGGFLQNEHQQVSGSIRRGHNNLELQTFLNSWLNVQKSAGTVQALYDKWILGKGAEKHSPRWSVIKDVLHWVKE